MTVLTEVLPFLEGWELKTISIPPNTVDPAGYIRTLYKTAPGDIPEAGFLLVAGTAFSNPNAMLRIRLLGPGMSEQMFNVSPFILNSQGMTVPNGWYWCSAYNPLIPLYVVLYLPDSRHTAWSEFVSMELDSVGIPTMIYNFSMIIVRVVDKERWIRSWRRLFGASGEGFGVERS